MPSPVVHQIAALAARKAIIKYSIPRDSSDFLSNALFLVRLSFLQLFCEVRPMHLKLFQSKIDAMIINALKLNGIAFIENQSQKFVAYIVQECVVLTIYQCSY